jgi:hypothetical protein
MKHVQGHYGFAKSPYYSPHKAPHVLFPSRITPVEVDINHYHILATLIISHSPFPYLRGAQASLTVQEHYRHVSSFAY